MEITEEAFTRLNTVEWRVLLVLNVRELDEDKCLAFDKYANVDFGRLTEQFGRRGGDYHGVEYFTKAYTMKRLLMRFTQKRSTKPSNTNPAL